MLNKMNETTDVERMSTTEKVSGETEDMKVVFESHQKQMPKELIGFLPSASNPQASNHCGCQNSYTSFLPWEQIIVCILQLALFLAESKFLLKKWAGLGYSMSWQTIDLYLNYKVSSSSFDDFYSPVTA